MMGEPVAVGAAAINIDYTIIVIIHSCLYHSTFKRDSEGIVEHLFLYFRFRFIISNLHKTFGIECNSGLPLNMETVEAIDRYGTNLEWPFRRRVDIECGCWLSAFVSLILGSFYTNTVTWIYYFYGYNNLVYSTN